MHVAGMASVIDSSSKLNTLERKIRALSVMWPAHDICFRKPWRTKLILHLVISSMPYHYSICVKVLRETKEARELLRDN